jgi:hypothetical protein
MFKALSFSAVIAAVAAATMSPAAAEAQVYGGNYYPAASYGQAGDYYQPVRYHSDRGYRGNRNGYRNDRYRGDRGRYYGDRRSYRGRCRDKGNGGTVIGAIAGGLLGHEVAGRGGDRTLGTIIGAGGGAVAGRLIDRNC